MTSSLSWLDFSEQEQRQVLGVIEAYRQRDTVDELGVGVVRDTFSDLLFPGTSTLHTRARYVFFIPWTYQAIERSPALCQDPWEHARWAEIHLIDALVDSEDSEGTIGRDARATLKMFPSTAYWAALAKWGPRLFPYSQDQYHRWLRAGGNRHSPVDPEDGAGGQAGAWHANLPQAPKGFPREASFRLEPHEAEYLTERIAMTAPGTLFAFLLERRIDVSDVEWPWELPAFVKLPAEIAEQLMHASRFSTVINGAPLLYNLMLAEKSSRANMDKLRKRFEERLEEWAEEINELGNELQDWDRGAFWQVVVAAGTSTPPPTRRFIDRWFELAIDGDPHALVTSDAARKLIKRRELEVKPRQRARLHSAQALALWGGNAGTARMAFRWPNAKQIVRDVVSGQEGEDA